MPRRREIPRGSRFWRQQSEALSISRIIRMYESGYAGAERWPEEEAAFRELATRLNGYGGDGGDLATAMGWAGSSAGKLGLAWVYAIDAFGAPIWPASAQERGDCVSHGTRNGCVLTLGCEIALGKPDEVTGRMEGVPELPHEGLLDGVLSTEAIYWWRDHGGDGWSCGHAASVVTQESGLWLRKNYPEFGVDLTKYSGGNAGLYGRTSPPQKFLDFGREHLIRRATGLEGWEQACDYLDNLYGVGHCGGQAWSESRDEFGFSPVTRGGWSHAESYLGFDRRPWVQQKFGCPALLLQNNSWGEWNSGPRDVYDSAQYVPANKKQRWIELGLVNPQTGNLMVPHGSRWVDCRTADSRSLYAFSSADGWPAQKLPDYGVNFL